MGDPHIEYRVGEQPLTRVRHQESRSSESLRGSAMTVTIEAASETSGSGQPKAEWRRLLDASVVSKSTNAIEQATTQGQSASSDMLTLQGARSNIRVRPPVMLAPRSARNRAFVASARWEGFVVEVFDTYFQGEVVDLITDERSTVEFELIEVTPHDLRLVEPGNLFYWSIGYETKEGGQRSRSSTLIFRRAGPNQNQ